MLLSFLNGSLITITADAICTVMSGDGSHPPHVVVDVVSVIVINVFVVVVTGVILDIVFVVKGVVVDIVVMIDVVRVVNFTNSPYILVVATVGRRRSNDAATPAKQRRRRLAEIIGCQVRMLVSVVIGRREAVYTAIGWSRRWNTRSG